MSDHHPKATTAPLHERLAALLVRDSTGREITPVFVPAAALREAAAALRPPEGEVWDLCERLSRGFEDASEFTLVVDKADLRTALAHLRRLAAVEAENKRLREALEIVAHEDDLYLQRFARAALAPAPAAEGD